MAKVVLSDGKEVEISGVKFNKEQNINISKTYITTVKKAVTKVSEDFYKVKEEQKVEEKPVFDSVPQETELSKVEEAAPVLAEPVTPEPVAPVLEEVANEMPSVPEAQPEIPVAIPVEEPKIELAPETQPIATPVVEPVLEPVIPEMPAVEVPPVLPVEEPKVELSAQPEVMPAPVEMPIASLPTEPTPEVSPVLAEPPIPQVIPSVVEPVAAPVAAPVPDLGVAPSEPQLVFDGSLETNLLSTQESGVQSLREFGVDNPQVNANVTPKVVTPTESQGKVLTKSKGFANNKFFMVIAIVFFIAACVFLGYEAFRYFQLVK